MHGSNVGKTFFSAFFCVLINIQVVLECIWIWYWNKSAAKSFLPAENAHVFVSEGFGLKVFNQSKSIDHDAKVFSWNYREFGWW